MKNVDQLKQGVQRLNIKL